MSLNALAQRINETAHEHGFYPPEGRKFAEAIALMHSELSEALEEDRALMPLAYVNERHRCEHGVSVLPCWDARCKPEGAAVELADALIRILDTMHEMGADIDRIVDWKMRYNAGRPYKHGKAY